MHQKKERRTKNSFDRHDSSTRPAEAEGPFRPLTTGLWWFLCVWKQNPPHSVDKSPRRLPFLIPAQHKCSVSVEKLIAAQNREWHLCCLLAMWIAKQVDHAAAESAWREYLNIKLTLQDTKSKRPMSSDKKKQWLDQLKKAPSWEPQALS